MEDGCVGIMWFLDSTRRAVESWLYGWMNGGQDKDGWGVVGLSAGNGCNCIYFVRRPFFACSAEGLFCRRRTWPPLELQLAADVDHRSRHFVAGEIFVVAVEGVFCCDIDFSVERRERL